MKNTRPKFLLLLWTALVLLAAGKSFGYEVWYGLPYMPKGAEDRLDEWNLSAELLQGLNINPSDTQRPASERNSNADWRDIVRAMPTAKENAVLGYPRTHFQYGTVTNRDTLQGDLVTKFRREQTFDVSIKWIMPFDNQPGEDRTAPIYQWSDAELQELRDWLDNNGHADVQLLINARNFGVRTQTFAQKPIMDGMSIEARASLWYENNGRRQNLLRWAVNDPITRDRDFKFQVPFGGYQDETQFQAMRGFMRWLSTPAMLGNTDFIRRDDVTFLVITYGPGDVHLPEKSTDGTQYENTMLSLTLSIIEQKDLFEGRNGGLITKAQTLSYDRFAVNPGPTSGLVAHWPLEEGAGTAATDASGFGSDGTLLNGATWGSDPTRGTHVVFDGTDDRIATPFTYALSSGDDFTWTWWANQTAPAGSKNGSIMVGNRFGGSGSENFEFIKLTPSQGQFANTSSASSIERYLYPTQVASNGWNHYAMVKSGTSYQWYVNGLPQAGPLTINYNETSPLPFFIGGDGDNTPNEHFQGGIDDVALYRSALSQAEVQNVIQGIYLPVVTMVALGSPADSSDGTTWSDGQPAHGGANYLVPANGNLRGEGGETIFPGSSLTVQAGGKFQVRAIEGEITTVNELILEGGPSFSAGNFVEITAGTGIGVTNVLDGTITQSGASRLVTYGNTIQRRLRVLARIHGDGTLQVTGEGVTIDNAGNSFEGLWEVSDGSELVFENAGSVGSAEVVVQAGSTLEVKGNWSQAAALTVADSAGTEVRVGPHQWTLASLLLGGTAVADGLYTPAELSSLGATQFSGTGRVTIGTPLHSQEVVAGWDSWTSNTNPIARVTGSGITASASASLSSGSWTISDDSGSGRGSSGDRTWGSFDGNSSPPSAITSGAGSSITAPNAVTSAELTLTISNNGASDWELDAFHMDVIAFRPNAPRDFQVEVVSGDITNGLVFTSESEAIDYLGGNLSGDHDDHDEFDLDLVRLADSTLEAGGTVVFRITFTNGTGSGAGHHLFLDNVAISGTLNAQMTELQSWRLAHFGTIENNGIAADRFDANSDGESNLLEFATGQNPHEGTSLTTPLEVGLDTISYRYPRSIAAVGDGMLYQVEWSDTLQENSWSTSGVIDNLDSINPGNGEVENRMATVPRGTAGKRFIRLKVSSP